MDSRYGPQGNRSGPVCCHKRPEEALSSRCGKPPHKGIIPRSGNESMLHINKDRNMYPPYRPAAGSSEEFYEEVYSVVCQIPAGKVLTYGDIARMMGRPGNARLVGRAMGCAPDGRAIPCHRVVNSRGATAPGWQEQRRLLEEEGVAFRTGGCVNLERHRWRPEDEYGA